MLCIIMRVPVTGSHWPRAVARRGWAFFPQLGDCFCPQSLLASFSLSDDSCLFIINRLELSTSNIARFTGTNIPTKYHLEAAQA